MSNVARVITNIGISPYLDVEIRSAADYSSGDLTASKHRSPSYENEGTNL
jgi:hypothetical protein